MSNLKYPLESVPQNSSSIKLLYVTSSSYEGDWPSFMHSHYFTELFYVKAGAGSFLIENESFPIQKDDLIIVNPNISHTEVSLPEKPLSYITLGVDGLSFSFQDEKNTAALTAAK